MRRWVGYHGIRDCRAAAALVVCGALLGGAVPALSQSAAPPAQPAVPAPAVNAPITAAPLAPVTEAPAPPAPQAGAPPIQAPPSHASQAAPAPPPAPRPGNPGFVEELGNFLKDSASHLSSGLKGSQKTLEDLNAKTKSATDGLTKMQSVMTGRAACPVAGNGAPDCNTAAEELCKTKGFSRGKSLDIETAEKCSARVYISGRTGAPGECRTENYVTRALCQ